MGRWRFIHRIQRVAALLRRGARGKHERTILTQLYQELVKPGDLVFDIGAHTGEKTAILLELGARVVAVEPQENCVRSLREQFAGRARIVPLGVAEVPGRRQMAIGTIDTVSTMEQEWVSSMKASRRFGGLRWNTTVEVDVTTLDRLIEEHGVPAFIKIDVEGFEPKVLRGLSRAVPCVSFEFVRERLVATEACIQRLSELGVSEFNYSDGLVSPALVLEAWVSAEIIMTQLRGLPAEYAMGDVYARSRV